METRLFKPKMDVVFKMLFGDKRNIEILNPFLQSILGLPKDEYEKIEIIDPQLKRETVDDKLGIVDVRLTTRTGKIVHIEMQVAEQDELPERVTYYMAKMLIGQLKSGGRYDTLQKVISIVVANFELVEDSLEYHHNFQMNDLKTGMKFTDLLEVNTLELEKLPDTSDNTAKYDWVRFLKAEKEEEFEVLAKKNPDIKKAYAELKRLSQDEEAQLIYEAREKAIRDDEARRRAAKNAGREEGRHEGIRGVAIRMLNRGMPVEQIVELTDMSVEEIEKLR